jgi:hypothetical protein
MKRLVLILAMAAGLFAASAAAWAHAFLDRAVPAVGATVAAPKEVSVWFTEQVEPAFSKIEVSDAAGDRVDSGDTHVDKANPKLLHVSLKPLKPGTYRVSWRVVSVDTHHTKGDFSFIVAP